MCVVRKVGDVFLLVVDYNQSLSEMIKMGVYDWENGNITQENFPLSGTGWIEIEAMLVHLNKAASTDEVLRHLDLLGLRPATIAELLAFGAANPKLQLEFSIVALGSVWVDPNCHRIVPYLDRDGSERGLNLYWFVYDWHKCCRFLAVRK